MKRADVLERKVIHTGKVFIKAGEDNKCAYIIQAGMVRSFVIKDENRVDIEDFGPGTIIGEVCLVIDEPSKVSFEALVDTTVVTITRQDFDKRLQRVDSGVKNILNQVIKKLFNQQGETIDSAVKEADVDSDAISIVNALCSDLTADKQFIYEKAMLPHINGLIKAIKKIKTAERHTKQKAAVKNKVEKVIEEDK